MRVFPIILSASLLCGALISPLWAQDKNLTEKPAACLWEAVSLYDQPGSKKAVVAIHFGEQITLTGELQKHSDNRMYVEAVSADGKEGWIHEYLIAPSGVAATVLNTSTMYERPNAATTVTGISFVEGELVIVVMDDFRDDWMHVIAPRRKREGWIRGLNNISTDIADIEAAALIAKAQKDTLKTVRIARLEALRESPIVAKSQLSAILENRIAMENNAPAVVKPATPPAPKPAVSRDISTNPTESSGLANARINPAGKNPAQEVVDVNTNKVFNKFTETGDVFIVEGNTNRANEFFCYHKTLKIGSTVFLSLPDNAGSIKLTVTDRLGKDRNAIIGISKELAETLTSMGSKKASIVYYQEK